jgi:FMN phosphatase YigB (HAD superfamily)
LKKYYKLVILSKVDNESFSFSNQKLGVEFDAIYTAEDVGSYKPSLRNFEYMLERLGGLNVTKEVVLHTAESMFHHHKRRMKWAFCRTSTSPDTVMRLPSFAVSSAAQL